VSYVASASGRPGGWGVAIDQGQAPGLQSTLDASEIG